MKEGGEDELDEEMDEPKPLFQSMQAIHTPSKNGAYPLHIAATFDSRKVIKLLIELGVDVSVSYY